MKRHYLDWVVVGESGYTYGSFTERRRAVEYAESIRRLRGLMCRVVPKSLL